MHKRKNKMSMKRQIELTIETATRWYNGCDKELKALALQTFPELEKKELPKSWEELPITGYYVSSTSIISPLAEPRTNHGGRLNLFATKEQAEASLALAQLSQLREVYRDGWEDEGGKDKHVIRFMNKRIEACKLSSTDCFLSFQSAEVRDLFLENFRDLIEQAKPLMS